MPIGSKLSFTSSYARTIRFPNMGSRNSDRTSPSPCSPEWHPLNSRTMACASSAIERILETSFTSLRLSVGRTWRQPTDAWAYQVPVVPYLRNTSVNLSIYSARCSRGTAQSSMKDTGFPSPFIDMTMLSPALRTDQISCWNPGSSALTTAAANPRLAMSSSRRLSRPSCSSNSGPANSTSSSASGSPLTNWLMAPRKAAFSPARSSSLRSISSTAVGPSSTMCRTESVAEWRSGKWHTPSTLCEGIGCRSSSMRVKKASVPSEPTSKSAMLYPAGEIRSIL